MKIGVTALLTDETASPAEVARLAETYGLESLWLPEHTHIPARRRSRHPQFRGELPREYARTLDVFVALMEAASASSRLLLGTGICIVPERDPILLAKTVATLDFLSSGRLLFGVGAGWNLEELENHGVDPADRFRILDERIEAMKAIWSHEAASFHGKHVSFEEIWSWPKPTQRPHPPILLGSNGPLAIDRAVRLGAHWLPGYHRDDDVLVQRIREFREKTQGRLGVTLSTPPLEMSRLARLADAGAERAFFMLPSTRLEGMQQRLEEILGVTSRL
jgi:probable F420-dependent oxidoreductase